MWRLRSPHVFFHNEPGFQAVSPRQTNLQQIREPCHISRQPFQVPVTPPGCKCVFCFSQAGATCLLFTQQHPSADGDGLGQCAWCCGRIIHCCWPVSIYLKETEQLHNYWTVYIIWYRRNKRDWLSHWQHKESTDRCQLKTQDRGALTFSIKHPSPFSRMAGLARSFATF